MLQQPPQNQQAQTGALPGDRSAAGAAATAAPENYVVFNADTDGFGEFRDGMVHLPESEVPLGFAGEEFDPLALDGATEILTRDYPTETDLHALYALRNPWRPRQRARAARRNAIFEAAQRALRLQPFAPGEMRCRLVCRHMFHDECWANCVAAGRPMRHERAASCPCCRGVGNRIAVRRCRDPNLVTQLSADGAQVARNLLGPEAEQPPPRSEGHQVDRGLGPDVSPTVQQEHEATRARAEAIRQVVHVHGGGQTPTAIPFQGAGLAAFGMPPPSAPLRLIQPPRREPQNCSIGGDSPGPSTPNTYRTDQGVRNTPDSRYDAHPPGTTDSDEDMEMEYVVLPRTPVDASDWARTTRAQLNPSMESRPADQAGEAAYHVETRFPNGKPALLLDIGSVGNLAGDER
eukprot:12893379-Alexandrium_andersonii.AAC.1